MFLSIIFCYFHAGEWFACSVKLISGLFSDLLPVRRSNPLRSGVRHQRGDEERHSRVVREGGDQGQGGERPGVMLVVMMIDQVSHVEKVLSIEGLTCSQIELEQILGLNQDLAPASYENANTIPNNNSKLKVRANTKKS